jgi:cell division protein FtsW
MVVSTGKSRREPGIFWLAFVLSVIGIVFILDAGYAQSLRATGSLVPRAFIMQSIYLVVGMLLYVAIINSNISKLKSKTYILLWIAFALMLLVFAPIIGRDHNNAKRWIGLGPAEIQPAEFFKLAIILYLAKILADKAPWDAVVAKFTTKRNANRNLRIAKLERIWPFVLVVLALIIIERQKDLGTACVVLLTAGAMFVSAPFTRKSAMAVALLMLPCLGFMSMKEQYRKDRLEAHFHRWDKAHINGPTYQVIHSELAISSGGLTGTGLGTGRAKHMIPAATSDYIMATVAEETGFLGTGIVLGLMFWLVSKLYRAAALMDQCFAKLVLIGVATWIGLQCCTNLMMANATLPSIGIPMPFLSAGGSSLVALWLAVGICDRLAFMRLSERKEVARARRRYGWWHRRPRLSRP